MAVLPAGDFRLATRPLSCDRITFGPEPEADVRIVASELDESALASVEMTTPIGRVSARLRLAGVHQALNAAAATAAAIAAGVGTDQISAGLAAARGSAWRMEIHRGDHTIVNDAYNANPDSMESALRTVAAMPGRHIAVVGIMAELGPIAVSEHRRLGRLAADLGFDPVVVVGEDPGLAAGAGAAARSVGNASEAAREVLGLLRSGDVVLVKASRVAGLEQLALELAAVSEDTR